MRTKNLVSVRSHINDHCQGLPRSSGVRTYQKPTCWAGRDAAVVSPRNGPDRPLFADRSHVDTPRHARKDSLSSMSAHEFGLHKSGADVAPQPVRRDPVAGGTTVGGASNSQSVGARRGAVYGHAKELGAQGRGAARRRRAGPLDGLGCAVLMCNPTYRIDSSCGDNADGRNGDCVTGAASGQALTAGKRPLSLGDERSYWDRGRGA